VYVRLVPRLHGGKTLVGPRLQHSCVGEILQQRLNGPYLAEEVLFSFVSGFDWESLGFALIGNTCRLPGCLAPGWTDTHWLKTAVRLRPMR
jgi:hypothetical protein